MPALIDELLALDIGSIGDDDAALARMFVMSRVRRAGSPTRLGVAVAAALIDSAVRLLAGRRFAELPPDERALWARRLSATQLPVAAEFVRLLRSLLITYAFERRYGPLVDEPRRTAVPVS